MEESQENNTNKTSEIFKGVFINIGIAAAAFVLYWVIALVMSNTENTRIIGVAIIAVSVFLADYYLISKYLKEKKYVAIGMIIAIVFPLLVVGTCSPIFMSLGKL